MLLFNSKTESLIISLFLNFTIQKTNLSYCPGNNKRKIDAINKEVRSAHESNQQLKEVWEYEVEQLTNEPCIRKEKGRGVLDAALLFVEPSPSNMSAPYATVKTVFLKF